MGTDYHSIMITPEQAAEIAWEWYGLKGEISKLPGELDFNFRINTPSESYLLKVSRPEVNEEGMLFQHAILDHLAASNLANQTPAVIPDREGHSIREFRDDLGQSRKVRLLSWMEGRLWSEVNPISDPLLFSLGSAVGRLTRALEDFDHPRAHRHFEWDLAQAEWTSDYLHLFSEEQQSLIASFQDQYYSFRDSYAQLRKGVVHNDANDNNIIASNDLIEPKVTAIIDYGDAIHTQIINDLAIAIAYAVMGKPDPLSAALPVVRGYHSQFPLQEKELDFLYALVAMRLVISVTKSALNKQREPDNTYLLVSEEPAWDLLKRWKGVREEHALFSFRNACGYTPHPNQSVFQKWAEYNTVSFGTLFPTLHKTEIQHLDLSLISPWVGHESELDDLEYFEYKLKRLQDQVPDRIIAGGYLEPRNVYTSPAYDKPGNSGTESRTIHLGIDLWVPAGSPVHTLYDGEVVVAVNDAGDKEYGGLIILKHQADQFVFYTLHGHLSPESLTSISVGQTLKKGDCLGYVGNYPENGNWVPHLHFQIMLSTLRYEDDFPGVAYFREIEVMKSICPDPNLLFKSAGLQSQPAEDVTETIEFREKHLGKSLSLSYTEPLKIVRGSGVYLIDHTGRKYLDTVNNVAHVGHEHPRVVKAGQQQMAILNTNTRYLHEHINKFAEELLNTFPQELSVVHVVNSGSEANELALRMAKSYTGMKDMIAVEVGYHGNSGACVDISSYKFDGKGGKGAPEHTHIVPLPDRYRGIYQGEDTGKSYAAHIQEQVDHIHSIGRGIAGFICESIISCGGQIELPSGYLKLAYESVRKGGGICIADEVQVGCGRVGSTFWGFQLHDVVPDIVTIGKPIGNGHPLAAVVCTQEVAEAFASGMEYFNTFGGNPVSSTIGLEVLRTINEEKLQEHALETGNYLKSALQKLKKEFIVIGDIRGQGLFLGMELADPNKKPLTEKAAYLVHRMKEMGVLMSMDGKEENVLKIKPPLVFSMENANELISLLRKVLLEDFMRLD